MHGVVRGGMWACEMVCCGGVTWFEVNYGAMWNVVWYVKCGAMWNVAFSDLVWCEMQNVRCRIWRGVDCGASLCGMLHNAKCGKLGDVKCGGVELWWWRMWHMQCAVVVWPVRCGKWCNVLWCQLWWCDDAKSRWGGMRCGIWCGVKCAVVLNVGVVWNSCGCGMVRCGLWLCDVEYVVLWDVVVWNGGGRQTVV